MLFALARRAPWLLTLAFGAMARTLRDQDRARKPVTKMVASGPAPDAAALQQPEYFSASFDGTLDALRHGAGGAVDELRALAGPWGFRYHDVTVPVALFHGAQDINVPVGAAQHAAGALPSATLTTYPDLAHLLSATKADDVVSAVHNG